MPAVEDEDTQVSDDGFAEESGELGVILREVAHTSEIPIEQGPASVRYEGRELARRYRLIRLLAEGGMGSVWVAVDAHTGDTVAVKLVSTRLSRNDPSVLARFGREADTLARLDHPHIVRIHDRGESDEGVPFIVMELLKGETLAQRLARLGSLDLYETSRMLRQAAEALFAAHQVGVVHRDVKPSNLFLVATGDDRIAVKVLDFGMAKHTDVTSVTEVTATGAMLGTPMYMSPEQLLEPRNVDAKADIWALGVVAYHAVTGRPPFAGETLAKLFIAITQGRIKPPSELAPHLPLVVDEWFDTALCRDASARFASALELAESFARIVEDLDDAVVHCRAAARAAEPTKGDASTLRKAPSVDQQDLATVRVASAPPKRPPPAKKAPRRSRPDADEAPVGIRRAKPSRPEDLLPYPQALMADNELDPRRVPYPMALLEDEQPDDAGEAPARADPAREAAARRRAPPPPRDRGRTYERRLLVGLLVLAAVAAGAVLLVRRRAPPAVQPVGPAPSLATPAEGMAPVPGGPFKMGCDSKADCDGDEQPAVETAVAPFSLDRAEVTVGEFVQCVQAGACTARKLAGQECNFDQRDRDRHPVNCVTWTQADAYCRWRGKRLPTEAEWEKAARGVDGRLYPWGDSRPTCRHAVMVEGGAGCGALHTAEVGSRPSGAGPYGHLDLAGNVAEWVADWYDPAAYGRPREANPKGPDTGHTRVIRGGGWSFGNAATLRVSNRDHAAPNEADSAVGFRCAR